MAKNLKRKLLFSGAVVLLLLIIAGASAVIWYQVNLMPVEKCDGQCQTVDPCTSLRQPSHQLDHSKSLRPRNRRRMCRC